MAWRPIAAAALCLGLSAPAQELVTPGSGSVSLPPGRVAELLDDLPRDLTPRSIDRLWPEWVDRSSQGWGDGEPWRRWVELLRREAAASEPDPARRAELAVLARLQGRDGDAWAHLLACAAEPERVATLLPLFSPGVPQDRLGNDGPLEDGALLTPALPPGDDLHGGLRWLVGKKIERREFVVGAAHCALTVSVDRDGLEVGLRHLSGGRARVRILPPLPTGIEPGLLFADWEKLPEHSGPVEFTLDAEASEHSLWITFHPPEARWPSPRPERLQALRPEREIVITSPRGDEPHLALLAESLGRLFGVRAFLRPEGSEAAAGLEPLVLHLGTDARAERKLVGLLGAAEAFALRPASR